MPKRGWTKPGLEAKERPSAITIAWAAGIYEGEGHAVSRGYTTRQGKGRLPSAQVTVTQRDPWLCWELKRYFGGTVIGPSKTSLHRWITSGARARGFLMTIYGFLSPRKKEQARRALRVDDTPNGPVGRGYRMAYEPLS